MNKCDHHGIQWDAYTHSECPICALQTQIDYVHIGDLRKCSDHHRVTFFDKDYGCAACQRTSEEPSLKETSVPEHAEIETKKQLETRLEKSGDHGRPDNVDSGMRWL